MVLGRGLGSHTIPVRALQPQALLMVPVGIVDGVFPNQILQELHRGLQRRLGIPDYLRKIFGFFLL